MSESGATTGREDSTLVEGEKVKAINGMKEVDEMKLQNGESERPQINGDVDRSSETFPEKVGSVEGGPEQNGKMETDKPINCEEKDGTSEKDVDSGADEDSEVGEDPVEKKVDDVKDKVLDKKDEDGEDESDKDTQEKEGGNDDAGVVKDDVKDKDSSSKDEDNEKEDGDEKEESDKENDKEKGDKNKDVEEKSEVVVEKVAKPEEGAPTPAKSSGKKKKSSDDIQEVPVTRQLRVRKTPKKYTEDDDDIKITDEVIRDDSDIEMIEESDPLALSDADVKKMQQKDKKADAKKDANVIIIDTNTLLKNQGNLAAAVAQSTSTPVQTVTQSSRASSVSSNPTQVSNMNIQSAIQAITGGVPAQGLQSAYITALQQVLLAQGGQVPMNSQHLAQLQQYYNSLGHLQDDAYVIEAPSFIVPYVMEGKPKEPIKTFLKRINDELDKFEKEQKAEEEKKRKEEEKKKKDEERVERRRKRKEVLEEKEKRREAGEVVSEGEGEGVSEDEEEKEEKTSEEGKKEAKEKEGDKDEEEMDTDEKTEDADKENKEEKDSKAEKDEKHSKVQSDVEEEEEDEDEEEEEEEEKKKKDKKKKKKNTEAEDGDKENKGDKSDSDSVVDLEKEGEDEKEKEKGEDLSHLGKWEPYYKSALGKFMLELGLNQAQEFLQSDLLRMQKRKLDKMKTQPSREGIMAVKILEKQLEITQKKNSHLHVPLKICRFCTYKTESQMVMERHLESPHMVNYTYKCNFCDFETRGPQIILFHMEAEHNVRGRLERAPAFFQCSLCPYEDNNKSKMTRHSFSCSKKYKPEKNCELLDWEPPAKIPKIHRGRPNMLGKAFEPVKMPNLLPKSLAGMNINIQSAVASNLINSSNAANLAAAAAGRGRGRPVGSYKNTIPLPGGVQARGNTGSLLYTSRGTTTTTSANLVQQVSGNSQQFTLGNQMFHSSTRVQRILPSSSASPVSLIPGLGASSSITIQPSISITPLPRGGQQPTQSASKGSAQPRDTGGKPSFVICEICDGYIKDLEQLRNHMNLIHKVKIHPKMIYNRPPLNCQKCQHRFFTDQGLERHLLGTHGLVTSSMQEAANKGKDAGRCPICGKVFQWKLLNHVSRDHKMTLKPAHLSYKCTVCTATFNMYRLFENHVYSAHSVVNKNKGDGSKKSSSGGSGSSDSPLKINDEITIIPQPAGNKSKSSSEKSPLSSSKKSEGTPTMSKEITITKVGSRPTRRSAGSVEVISLDESPKKSLDQAKKRSSRDSSVGSSSKKPRTS